MSNNKDIDELLKNVFGKGSNARFAPIDAKRYLEDSKKTEAALSQLDESGSAMNARLSSQLEEMKKMTSGLDFEAIERRVEADFGTTAKAVSLPPATPIGIAGFSGVLQKLQTVLVGQDAFLKSLFIAFKRPFVMGHHGDSAKNVILVYGKKNSGRHTALSAVARLLAESSVLASPDIFQMDLSIYPTQGEEKLFLQDLFSAFSASGEVVVFNNYELCHPSLLGQLCSLATDGVLRLNTRYVLQKGRLLDSGNALSPDAVGQITPKAKYLVFVSEHGKTKLSGKMGASMVNALGDTCKTSLPSAPDLLEIAKRQYALLAEKCKMQLAFTLVDDGNISALIAKQCTLEGGVGAMLDFCQNCYKAFSQYKLEHDSTELSVKLSCKDTLMADFGDGVLPLLSLLSGSYLGEKDAVRAEVASIIGLGEIKSYIFSLENHFKVQAMRRAQGMQTGALSMHMIFTGNPGTGKTTIARLVSKYLKAIGVLSGGQLVEVTRADLVGKYVGHTAPLTTQVIKSAIGGVLFIDEAYSLYRGGDDSFGLEAIDTLVKGIEDNRDDLVVILAGYSKEMEGFLSSNSGLKSRFPNIIEFPDYSGEELLAIACKIAKGKGYEISTDAQSSLLDYFSVVQAMENRESGNGRLARNVVERAILDQAKRIIAEPASCLDMLLPSDFDLFA